MTTEETKTGSIKPGSQPTKIGLLWFGVACMFSMLAGMFIQTKVIAGAPSAKVAIVGKNEIILRAMLEHPQLANSPEDVKRYLVDPINKFQSSLANNGYIVLEASKDEQGAYSVNAMPAGYVDQTESLNLAVKESLKIALGENGPKK